MSRIRVQTKIDRDAVSPDSINAANTYLLGVMLERTLPLAISIDWNTWRTYARTNRHGELVITHWARVLK